MTRFSQRIGAQPIPRQIQIGGMDDELRSSLWNEITVHFVNGSGNHWILAAKALARHLFKIPVDTVPETDQSAYKWIRDRFFEGPWYQAYDMLEFLVINVDPICNPPTPYHSYYQDQRWQFLQNVNMILERELSGYRFVKGVLVPISDPAEIAEIEAAAYTASRLGIQGAHAHVAAALGFLGQKPNPDYRNSIKEAISAVESTVNLVTGSGGNGVAGAVEELAKHTPIHPALKSALKQLYGYTSDADGVRHAIMDEPTVGFDEAKFMLVTCSAFVNFLASKANAAGLIK